MDDKQIINLNSWNITIIFCILLGVIGCISNINVQVKNDNKMPVKDCGEFNIYYSSIGYVTFCEDYQVNDSFYSDRFKINIKDRVSYYSLGDFLIYFSLCSTISIYLFLLISFLYSKYNRKKQYGF